MKTNRELRVKYKRKMRMAKYQKTADLDIVRSIQTLFIKNLIAYKDNIRDSNIKQVIKNCYKIADHFVKIEEPDDLFSSEWIRKETKQLEDKFYNSKYRNFGVEYEAVQVAIHNQLRDIGFDHCLDHKINLHYCDSCKSKFNLGEDGDV